MDRLALPQLVFAKPQNLGAVADFAFNPNSHNKAQSDYHEPQE